MKAKYFLALLILLAYAQVFECRSKGTGAYYTMGYTNLSQEFNYSYDRWSNNFVQYGVGFVYDSKVAADRLFNYRINLGIEGYSPLKSDTLYDMSPYKISIGNTFGFGFYRSEEYRVWLGPQVGLGYLLSSGNPNVNQLEFSYGVVSGFNYHLDSAFSMGVELGFKYTTLIGSADYTKEPQHDPYYYGYSRTLTGNEFIVYLRLSVLIRNDEDFFKPFPGRGR